MENITLTKQELLNLAHYFYTQGGYHRSLGMTHTYVEKEIKELETCIDDDTLKKSIYLRKYFKS